MDKLVRFALLTVAFVLSGTAFGQSNLPACQGTDVNGWSNCFGSWTASNGNRYVGEFKDGKRNGQGTVTYADGDKYVGEWKDDKFNGQGTYTLASGSKYVGEFKDYNYDGQGTYTLASGFKFVGEFKDNQLNGQGITYSVNGNIKESGIFKDWKLVTSQYIDPNSFTRIARNKSAPAVSDSACQGTEPSRWNNCFGSWTASNGHKYVGEWKDDKFNGQGTFTYADGTKYVGEFKDDKFNGRGIIYSANGNITQSGIYKDNTLVTSQYIDPNSFTRIARNNSAPAVSDSQRQAIEQRESQVAIEAERLAEQKRKFDAEKEQREQEKKASRIAIKGSATQPDANGDFTITIQTGADTASLKIDGEELGGKRDGNYVIKRVARVGEQNTYTIAARDVYGNTDIKTISVARQAVDSRPTFARLNPANVNPRPARDAVAIIIGIQNYKLIPKAEYANQDAQDFYDYASRALGIKQENIKLLLDDEADVSGILIAFQEWLPLKVRKGKTDVYVFYSGHGLPSTDGKSLYFMPVGANKNLVAKTAISQREIVDALKAIQPKSVTMFIDSCYSGQIRTGETLLASARPVVMKVDEVAYPPEFTVITASASDQIASSSPDLKHGIFSYYLMKGLEGEADENKDGTITIGKLQSYLAERVPRFAMTMSRKQVPQLTGDANRVLVAK